ncbi:MAG: hypothetical protein WBL64_10295 [Nitrososphaeraceae archaeon]
MDRTGTSPNLLAYFRGDIFSRNSFKRVIASLFTSSRLSCVTVSGALTKN